MVTQSHYMSEFPLIIAVSGKLGSGKDHVIENYILPSLNDLCNLSKMAFADHIKINVASQQQIPLEQCLQGKKSAELRRALQIAGTEEGRDKFHDDIWITTLENWIKLRQIRGDKLDVILVTDCRFLNEAKWVEDKGGLLIRVNALDRNEEALLEESKGNREIYVSIKNHASETQLDDYIFEYAVDNSHSSGIFLLRSEIRRILERYTRAHLNRAHIFK
jgi:hypothetical protein